MTAAAEYFVGVIPEIEGEVEWWSPLHSLPYPFLIHSLLLSFPPGVYYCGSDGSGESGDAVVVFC